jgi:hypothetical protein
MSKQTRPQSADTLTTEDAAALVGVRASWLLRHRKALGGKVRRNSNGHNVARFPRANLEALIRERQALADRPPDPDLIFVEEAEDITRACRPTLYTLAKREDLGLQKIKVLDSKGKAHWRPVFSKSKLRSLFIERPAPGEPIRLPSGETWYLRDDALRHFRISNIVLSYWTEQESRTRSGKALRTRHFHVIVGRAIGTPKRLTAWRGEDLEAISSGKEGVKPIRGKTAYARQQREGAQAKAEAALHAIKPHLPQLAAVAVEHLMRQGISRFLIYKLKDAAGIVSDDRHEGKLRVSYWMKPGQRVPTAEQKLAELPEPRATAPGPAFRAADQMPQEKKPHTVAPAEPEPTPEPAPRARRGPGRPPGQTKKWLAKVEQLIELWVNRKPGDTKASLAKKVGMNRPDASKIINEFENKQRRKA